MHKILPQLQSRQILILLVSLFAAVKGHCFTTNDYVYIGSLTYSVKSDGTAAVRLLNDESVKELIISSHIIYEGELYTVNAIGKSAFNRSQLTSIIIPNTVTSIGEDAFIGCAELTSIDIPNSVTSIGDNAFYECTGLTSVSISNSVTSISDGVFFGCTALKSIDIPNTVTSIGNTAFAFTGLTSIVIPNSISYIGAAAFSCCSELTSIAIPNSVTSIEYQTFAGCTNLTSIEIPNSVTNIGEETFGNCTALKSLIIPNSVTHIGKKAFAGCTDMTSVEIPNSVTEIGDWAFDDCNRLSTVTIPTSVISLGSRAFYYCKGLVSVYYLASNPIAGPSDVFNNNTYSTATLYVTEGAKDIVATLQPWNIFQNIQIYDSTNIDEIIADMDETLPYEIFDLNGVMVGNTRDGLVPGIYIVRQGNAVKKISVK